MSKVIAFTVTGSSNIYQLEAADTLVGFLDYDFTYFWEQCLELAHKSRLTGEYYHEYAMSLKEYIRTCHPYYNVLMRTEFDKIVLDCIIDFIVLSENIGLEELWARYISAKDSFGREVFARISEYKTGSAINQWANLLRMQEYAQAKAAFIFGGTPAGPKDYQTRKQYFDLAFSLTAQEMGYRTDELPSVLRSPVALLPEAGNTVMKAAHALLPIVRPFVREKRAKPHRRKAGCMHDQAAGLVFNAMAELPRPGPIEMEAATDTFRDLPPEVFLPTCFKALIDLEFDKMLEEGLVLQQKPGGKGYLISAHFGRGAAVEAQVPQQQPPAESVHAFTPPDVSAPEPPAAASDDPVVAKDEAAAGHVVYPTPTEHAEAPAEAPQSAPKPKQEAPVPKQEAPAPKQQAPAPTAAPPKETNSRPARVQEMANSPARAPSNRKAAQNINVRCQLVYTALYACVTNKTMTEAEFEEWSRHLMSIRRSIIKREMTVDDLERYLDSTEEIYPQITQTPQA